MNTIRTRALLTLAIVMLFSMSAWAQQQVVTPNPAASTVAPSTSFSFDANYTTTPTPNTKTTGLGIQMFWNNNEVNLVSLTNILTTDFLAADCNDADGGTDGNCVSPNPQLDTLNADGDAATTHFVGIGWADFAPPPGFPAGTEPVRLFTANFTSTANLATAEVTTIRFDDTTVAAGFTFASTPHTVTGAAAPLPVVTVTATDAAASEPGADTGTFTFSRTGSTAATLTATYTVSGTATAGTDYTALSGTVTFAIGSATATATVTPIDDATFEGSETVIVTLAAGAGYTVGTPSSATVTIADNDGPGVASVTCPSGLFVGGAAGSGTVTLAAAAPAGGQVVTLSSSATGSATVPASVTVPAGSTSTTFSVTPGSTVGSSTITATANAVARTCTVAVAAAPAFPIPTLSGLGLSILIGLLGVAGVFLMAKLKM